MSPRLAYLTWLTGACVLAACGSAAKPAPAPVAPPAEPTPAPAAAAALDPAQPTLRLPRNFLPTTYRARLALDPATDGFTGAIEIDAQVSERSKGFWLHGRGLTVTAARLTAGGRTLPVTVTKVGDELLSLRPSEPVDAGKVTLAITYQGAFNLREGVGAYKQQADGAPYVMTQFEATYARRAFPCFDEPDNKVPWQLTLDVPKDLVAVTNTAATGETALDAKTKRVTFAPTRPLPSYLLAFGVGPFELVDAGKTRTGTPIRIIALKGRAHEARWSAETSAKIIGLLEDYFGAPYPYDKLDQLSTAVSSGGAMENAGLVIYARSLILADPAKITPSARYAWVSVAAHELAHQWFGDLVTTAWWDDIWLNEGFASWLADKVTGQFDPSYGGELIAVGSRKQAVFADSAVTARRIRQPIRDTGDIFQAFDGITYGKGASILAMFERAIGPDKFRDGVRAYIAKHQDRSATSADFIAAISAVAGHDVAPAFHTFLDQPGVPVVRAELRCAAGKPPVVALSQKRYVLPGSPVGEDTRPWHIPLCVAFDKAGQRAEACTELTEPTAELALDAKACPAWLFANAGGRGYFLASQPDAATVALRDRGWAQLTPVERAVAFDDLVAFAAAGEADVALPLSLIKRLVADRRWISTASAYAMAARVQGWVDDAQRPKVDAWIRATFGPTARAYGWSPRAKDDLDADRGRASLVTMVAWSGDPQLRAAAVVLAKDPRQLVPSNRSNLLAIAAETDKATFERLLAGVTAEPDPQLRADTLRALGQVTDPAKLARVLPLMFDAKLEPRDQRPLVYAGHDLPQYRLVATYVADHLDQILEHFPDDGLGGQTTFAFVFLRDCDPAQRDARVAYVRARFGKMLGAERLLDSGIEQLDHCIAAKKLLGPKVAAWLAKGAR
jgi:alanyl aminopeptidase